MRVNLNPKLEIRREKRELLPDLCFTAIMTLTTVWVMDNIVIITTTVVTVIVITAIHTIIAHKIFDNCLKYLVISFI
jgi:hypothetical protein